MKILTFIMFRQSIHKICLEKIRLKISVNLDIIEVSKFPKISMKLNQNKAKR